MSEYKRPLPVMTSPVSKEFWDATKRHELKIQQCRNCGKNIFYPKDFCPECLSTDLRWIKASGKGRIYSFTVAYSGPPPGFDVPYVLAIIELNEGVRMYANIVDCNLEELKCDMPVEVVFEDVTKEITMPRFKPATT